MVLLRVRMTGSGVQGDPFTAPLPSFQMVSADYVAGTCIVEIPNRWLPNGIAQIGFTSINLPDGRRVITGIRAADQQTVADYMDAHYPDYAGLFRPQLQ